MRQKSWIFVVEFCTTKSDNMSFWWDVLKTKATEFCHQSASKRNEFFFLLTWVTRVIGFRYNCVK